MPVTVTVRPGARTSIRELPFEGRGAGYWIIGEIVGRNVQVAYTAGAFSVPRTHTARLIDGLARRYGSVKVVHRGDLEKCVEACWRDGAPENAAACRCSCVGTNHGSGTAFMFTVGDRGRAGALSVQPAAWHSYIVRG